MRWRTSSSPHSPRSKPDDDVRCILWRAEGRAFSSGRDLKDLGNHAPGQSDYHYIHRGHAATHRLLAPPKVPVVYAIQGWCIGGVFERTLLCDLRIASSDAKFRLPELAYGLVPDSGGTARVVPDVRSWPRHRPRVHGAHARRRRSAASWHRVACSSSTSGSMPRRWRSPVRLPAAPPLAVRAWRQNLLDMSMPLVTKSLHDELSAQMLIYKSDDFAEFKRRPAPRIGRRFTARGEYRWGRRPVVR